MTGQPDQPDPPIMLPRARVIDERSESMGGGDPTGFAGGAGGKAPRGVDEPPPFWGHWGRIYLLVAGLLLIETLVFRWLAGWAT
jgi:hypothetical protein